MKNWIKTGLVIGAGVAGWMLYRKLGSGMVSGLGSLLKDRAIDAAKAAVSAAGKAVINPGVPRVLNPGRCDSFQNPTACPQDRQYWMNAGQMPRQK